MRLGWVLAAPAGALRRAPASGLASTATTRSPRSDEKVLPRASVIVVLPTPPFLLITTTRRDPSIGAPRADYGMLKARFSGGAGISRSHEHPGGQRTLRRFPGKRMFATTGANNENIHAESLFIVLRIIGAGASRWNLRGERVTYPTSVHRT